jgi:serralysin
VRVSYTSIDGTQLELVPWEGQHVAYLTQSEALDPDVMARIVAATDEAWEFYASVTGREPTPFEPFTLNGRGTIADVPTTCGAGCGFLGFTGIELQSTFFRSLYDGVANNNRYDQPVFYELGRNFWFYGDQLGAIDPFVTGFAIVNRFLSMDAAGVAGSPVDGVIDFEFFREQILQEIGRLYLADPASTWQSTLLNNQVPANPIGLGATDVAGSLFYRLHEDMGPQAYTQFFRALENRPLAQSPDAAVENFIAAAESATGADYHALFKEGFALAVGSSGDDAIEVERSRTHSKGAGFGFQGDDTVYGHKGVDHLFGGLGDDELKGLAEDDQLVGAAGDDWLHAGRGKDWLAGGEGDDLMKGGPGADTFVFRPGWGDDTISDFRHGVDKIDLRGFEVASFAELAQVATIVQDCNEDGVRLVRLELGEDSLTIFGINELRAKDLEFHPTERTVPLPGGEGQDCGCSSGRAAAPGTWDRQAAALLQQGWEDAGKIEGQAAHAHSGLWHGMRSRADDLVLVP